jgi:type I restriction enzyme S subunit
MANNWTETTWGNLATLEYGKSLHDYQEADGPYRVYGTNGPIGRHNEPLCTFPSVIIGRKGAYRGVHFSPKPFFVIDTAFYLKPKAEFDIRWAYYELLTHDINGMDSGSAIPSTSRESFYSLPVKYPPLSEQRAIANILGTLDDKIELNRRMNKTLEEIARAIFKSWFIDFEFPNSEGKPYKSSGGEMVDSELWEIPKGWKVSFLKQITDFVIGGDWGEEILGENATEAAYCIRGTDIPDLQDSALGSTPIRYLKKNSLSTRSLQHGDLVFEISGGSPTQQTGRTIFITKGFLNRLKYPLVCSNFCRLIRPKKEVPSAFVYLWLRYLYSIETFWQYEIGTTGIKNFAFRAFSEKYPLVLPSEPILYRFGNLMAPFFEKRDTTGSESDILASLRDTLLPKLLSGQIRVKV